MSIDEMISQIDKISNILDTQNNTTKKLIIRISILENRVKRLEKKREAGSVE